MRRAYAEKWHRPGPPERQRAGFRASTERSKTRSGGDRSPDRDVAMALSGWGRAMAWVHPGDLPTEPVRAHRTTRAPRRQRHQDAALAHGRSRGGSRCSRTTPCGRGGLKTTQISPAKAARTVMEARAQARVNGSGPELPSPGPPRPKEECPSATHCRPDARVVAPLPRVEKRVLPLLDERLDDLPSRRSVELEHALHRPETVEVRARRSSPSWFLHVLAYRSR